MFSNRHRNQSRLGRRCSLGASDICCLQIESFVAFQMDLLTVDEGFVANVPPGLHPKIPEPSSAALRSVRRRRRIYVQECEFAQVFCRILFLSGLFCVCLGNVVGLFGLRKNAPSIANSLSKDFRPNKIFSSSLCILEILKQNRLCFSGTFLLD